MSHQEQELAAADTVVANGDAKDVQGTSSPTPAPETTTDKTAESESGIVPNQAESSEGTKVKLISVIMGHDALRQMLAVWSALLWLGSAAAGVVVFQMAVAQGLPRDKAAAIGAAACLVAAIAIVCAFYFVRISTPNEPEQKPDEAK